MPSEMAVHNSLTLSRNAMIAMIAMTTSTPTKIAYSVVPCARSSFDRTGAATVACP